MTVPNAFFCDLWLTPISLISSHQNPFYPPFPLPSPSLCHLNSIDFSPKHILHKVNLIHFVTCCLIRGGRRLSSQEKQYPQIMKHCNREFQHETCNTLFMSTHENEYLVIDLRILNPSLHYWPVLLSPLLFVSCFTFSGQSAHLGCYLYIRKNADCVL